MSRAFCCASLLSLVLMALSAGCEPSATPVAPTLPSPAEASASASPTASPTSSSTAPSPAASAASAASGHPDAASQPAMKTLFVRELLVDCEGEGPMKCMQVRESEKEEWTLFYGNIEGFTYEPGFAYELRVTTQSTPKPPAGGSSRKVRLAEVVAKKPARGK